jgi:hypothetical protein
LNILFREGDLMKLVIKTIIDIPACIFLIQISDLIVFGIFQATGLASNLLVAVIALMMLYCINLTLDEVTFLKMSKAKNMLSIVISTLIIDLYFAYKVFLFNYFDDSEKEINVFYFIAYLMMLILSLIISIILDRFKRNIGNFRNKDCTN